MNKIHEKVDEIIAKYGKSPDSVIPILQAIQNVFNYLPHEALVYLSEATEITPARIAGVSTFYTQFRHEPAGKHIIKVCVGTACHVKGAMRVYDAFRRELKLADHHDTDSERRFTVEKVACLGCCTLAPVVQVDNITYGHVIPDKVHHVLRDFLSQQADGDDKPANERSKGELQGEIRIGLGSCCVASGSAAVQKALESTLEKTQISVNVKHVGCVGICNQVPILEVIKHGEVSSYYTKVKPEDINKIVLTHFKSRSFIQRLKNKLNHYFERLLIGESVEPLKHYPADMRDTPITTFLDRQIHIATENRGIVKPTDIDEYKLHGGFAGLLKCLKSLKPIEIIELIKTSGLRGRGGAGFPTGKKWELVYQTDAPIKYIICNGDEGDPGAFMDRMLLESYPFRVIEGMIIAAYAMRANVGFFYIRAEYPLAVKRINEAIEHCEKSGILGNNILGSDFSLTLKVVEGAGAFICGEETAMIASIEGKRGSPRLRPPYPSQNGLWGAPTLINNTETYSLVAWIIRNGADAFHNIGTATSKGTKVFALAGKIARGGLIEVPMGISIREIVEQTGGGIADGKTFKAVQIGGPSGGCIPASMADIPIDYESLIQAGAMMGSGGLVVLDESDCMVDIARYFLSFTQDQSCGKCTFCRIGTKRMLEILDKFVEGKGTKDDLLLLEHLAITTKRGSLCGLGRSAPNPIITTIKYFRHEYEAHIEGRCVAKRCQALIAYTVTDDCIGCTICAQKCPADAIEMKPYEKHFIDVQKCIKCDICKQACPNGSIVITDLIDLVKKH